MCDAQQCRALHRPHTHAHTSELTRSTCCNGSLLGSYMWCEWHMRVAPSALKRPERPTLTSAGGARYATARRRSASTPPFSHDRLMTSNPAQQQTAPAVRKPPSPRTHSLSPLPVPHTAARQRRQQQAPGVAGGSERCQRQNIPRCAALLSGRHQTRDAPSASGRRERGKRPAPRLAPPSACRASRSPVVQLGRHSLVWHLTRLPSPGTTSG